MYRSGEFVFLPKREFLTRPGVVLSCLEIPSGCSLDVSARSGVVLSCFITRSGIPHGIIVFLPAREFFNPLGCSLQLLNNPFGCSLYELYPPGFSLFVNVRRRILESGALEKRRGRGEVGWQDRIRDQGRRGGWMDQGREG